MYQLIVASLLLASSSTWAADSREGPVLDFEQRAQWGFAEDTRGLLHSSSSSLNTGVARETTGPDTFAIYGGPDRPLEGRFEDGGGAVSWNGWTTFDQTEVPVFWYVDTFNSENLNGNGAGNHSMWCGQSESDQPLWRTPPGYGDNWNSVLIYESGPVPDTATGQLVTLDFRFNHELEIGYDFFYVEYDSAGTWTRVAQIDGTNKNESDSFPAPGIRFSDIASREIVYTGHDYGGEQSNQVRVRFRVVSDGAWSDEDGFLDTTAGAIQLDDIVLTTNEGTFAEDFEGLAPYLLTPEKFPFAGDFADVIPALIDVDPCRSNYTPMAGFIDFGQEPRNGPGTNGLASTGGSASGVQYGIPGNWVTNYNGGLSLGVVSLSNAIVSPEIDWDLPGSGDDGVDFVGAVLRFDIWAHLPLINGMFYWLDVFSAAPGGLPERGFPVGGWFYYNELPVWTTKQFDISDALVTDPEWVQVRLWVVDFADQWGFPGTAGTPSPQYDNVAVYKYRQQGPNLVAQTQHLPQDSFSPAGSRDVSTVAARDALDVPIDMAMDVHSGSFFVVPGDSIVVAATARIPGTAIQDLRLMWTMKTNPLFEDAIRSAPSGSRHSNVVAGPAGTEWSGEVTADTCRSPSGSIQPGRFFFNLPDVDFMYPGDVIQYCIRATDSDGRVSTLPSDLTGFGQFDHSYPRYGTAHALPSVTESLGAQPSILVLNDRGNEINFPEFRQSMTELGKSEGIEYDIYWKRAPGSTPNSNGIGTAGAHGASVEQLSGYTTILYFSGTGTGVLLADGMPDGLDTKSDDIGLLESWHRVPGRRNMAYFGDRLAQAMTTNAAIQNYLNSTMGVEYVASDVVPHLGGQRTPIARPVDPAYETDYLTYFNCQLENQAGNTVGVVEHSHIMPASFATYGHKYLDPSTGQLINGAAASVIFPSPNAGVVGYDLTFPYSLSWIYPRAQRTVGVSDRTVLLQEILSLFQESPGSGGPVSAPAHASLELRIAPNPFNPRTIIRFAVLPGQRGTVRVFTLRGELVRTLHDGEFEVQEFTWDGVDNDGASVASGVYFVRASADGQVRVAKVALVR